MATTSLASPALAAKVAAPKKQPALSTWLKVTLSGPSQPNASVHFGASVRPITAYTEMCVREPEMCIGDDVERPVTYIMLNDDNARTIVDINRKVNKAIRPVSDPEHYGVVDIWTRPKDGRGDCEDIQLAKGLELDAAGFPRGSRAMAVVLDEKREGHAVMLLFTNRGTLVLDNKSNEVRLWNETGYHFIKAHLGSVWRAVVTAEPEKVEAAAPEPVTAPPAAGIQTAFTTEWEKRGDYSRFQLRP